MTKVDFDMDTPNDRLTALFERMDAPPAGTPDYNDEQGQTITIGGLAAQQLATLGLLSARVKALETILAQPFTLTPRNYFVITTLAAAFGAFASTLVAITIIVLVSVNASR